MSDKKYDVSKIQALTALEAIRKRPGMYVGALDDPTLASRLILEGCCASLESAKNDETTEITIEITNDFTATITDNGPGWPLSREGCDIPWPIAMMTRIYACKEAKLDAEAEGFCHMGITVTVALSAISTVTIHRENKRWSATLEYGSYQGYEESCPVNKPSGTELLFVLDTGILKDVRIDADYLKEVAAKYSCAYDCDIKVVDHRKSL
jgi:DNA gyrase/topoisomerase IV subunit B